MAENQASNAAADVEMSQYVADRTRVNEDKIKQDDEIIEQFGDYNYGWHDTDFAGEAAKKGIDENVVRAISADKHEPEWMLEKRLEGYRDFINRPMPQWGVDLKDFDADDFKYYVKPIDKQATTWEELPDEIRSTYDKLGIPEAEKSRLVSGVAAQYESEVIYNSIQKDLEEQGVIFVDTDTAVQKYPELVKKYFGKCIPSNDNKFSALNTAAWSGGSFVYVPPGVKVGEDVLFNLDAFYAARSWRMTRQSVYRYDLGGDSAMARAKGQVYESAKPMLCGITRFIRKNGLQTALFRAHIDIYLRTLRNDRGRRGAASAFDRAVAACVTEGVRFSELGAKQKAYYIALRVCPRTTYFLP